MNERRLRVVYIDHCARLSGAEIALLRLLPALMREVDPLVILGEDGPLVQRLQDVGARVEVVPLPAHTRDTRKHTIAPGRLNISAAVAVLPHIQQLTRRLRQEAPDLVHTNSLKAALYGGVAARLAGLPLVWYMRDRIAPDYLPASAVALVRAASHVLPHAVIANSASTLSTLPAATRGPVHHRAVISDAYEAGRQFERRRTDTLIVGMVGRLTPWKGQHVFLEAFAGALAGTGARGRLIGSAMFEEEAYEQQLRDQCESLGIADQIEFRGFRDDVEAELAELDILVHCSTSPEPFGQVVVEGMAAQLPVIAADEGGPAEIIQDEVDGLLVPARRPDLLARALVRLAGDENLRRRLGAAAATSCRRFTPGAAADRTFAVYRQVLHPRQA